eukprot:7389920-Prymnesium_polylepis.1
MPMLDGAPAAGLRRIARTRSVIIDACAPSCAPSSTLGKSGRRPQVPLPWTAARVRAPAPWGRSQGWHWRARHAHEACESARTLVGKGERERERERARMCGCVCACTKVCVCGCVHASCVRASECAGTAQRMRAPSARRAEGAIGKSGSAHVALPTKTRLRLPASRCQPYPDVDHYGGSTGRQRVGQRESRGGGAGPVAAQACGGWAGAQVWIPEAARRPVEAQTQRAASSSGSERRRCRKTRPRAVRAHRLAGSRSPRGSGAGSRGAGTRTGRSVHSRTALHDRAKGVRALGHEARAAPGGDEGAHSPAARESSWARRGRRAHRGSSTAATRFLGQCPR